MGVGRLLVLMIFFFLVMGGSGMVFLLGLQAGKRRKTVADQSAGEIEAMREELAALREQMADVTLDVRELQERPRQEGLREP